MTMKMRAIIYLVVLALAASLQIKPAASQELRGKHHAANLACAACHKGNTTGSPKAAVCSECHGDYTAVAKLTSTSKPNPHASHEGDLRCTLCHRVHQTSTLYCNQCHQFDLPLK